MKGALPALTNPERPWPSLSRRQVLKAFLLAPLAAVGAIFGLGFLLALTLSGTAGDAVSVAFWFAFIGAAFVAGTTLFLALPAYIALVLSQTLSRRVVFAGAVLLAPPLPGLFLRSASSNPVLIFSGGFILVLALAAALTAAWVFCQVLRLEP